LENIFIRIRTKPIQRSGQGSSENDLLSDS